MKKFTQNICEKLKRTNICGLILGRWGKMRFFEKIRNNFKRILCGSAVGVANGLFGGGGGMLAVPLLEQTGLKGQRAHATAILVILPVSAFSFFFYALRGYADFSVLIPTAIGVSVGGILGAKILKFLPEKILSLVFAVLQALAGLWLIFA